MFSFFNSLEEETLVGSLSTGIILSASNTLVHLAKVFANLAFFGGYEIPVIVDSHCLVNLSFIIGCTQNDQALEPPGVLPLQGFPHCADGHHKVSKPALLAPRD